MIDPVFIAKYGTTVADNPLSLRRAIAEIDAQELRDIDDMVRAGKSVVPEDAGGCGNVGMEASE